jgi:ubiquinone/menaquinone biosynthesis C-methylase UbiE
MVEAVDKGFDGSIPDLYDEYLVPLIFNDYADDLAERAGALNPSSVLEVAAGSGVVTRAVAAVLDAEARYVVTDLNPPMLQAAEARQNEDDRITWRHADAMDLPFPDDTFDLVLCQFGAMFFPDRVQAYTEARRVLREGGTFIFNMWDRIEANEFADMVTRSMAEIYPKDPPGFLARTPHGHYDPDIYRAELAQAGFEETEVESLETESVAPNAGVVAFAYCQGTPLKSEIEDRQPPGLVETTTHAEEALRRQFGSGEVRGRIAGFVVTAR